MTADFVIQNREEEVLRFMKERGYGIYHASAVFLRDIQYGIRDYHRHVTGKDLNSRMSDKLASEVIDALETKGILKHATNHTWILNHKDFLNPPKQEPEKKD